MEISCELGLCEPNSSDCSQGWSLKGQCFSQMTWICLGSGPGGPDLEPAEGLGDRLSGALGQGGISGLDHDPYDRLGSRGTDQ